MIDYKYYPYATKRQAREAYPDKRVMGLLILAMVGIVIAGHLLGVPVGEMPR